MTDSTSKDWIRALKPGDTVAILRDYDRRRCLAQVTRVSPTGSRITTTKGCFTGSGYEHGGWKGSCPKLLEPTPGLIKCVEVEQRLYESSERIYASLRSYQTSKAHCLASINHNTSLETLRALEHQFFELEGLAAVMASTAHSASFIHGRKTV